MARFLSPFDTMARLQQALDSYRTSPWLNAGLSGGGAFPPINVFRKGDGFALVAEMPGVAKGDIEIQVKGRSVRLSGNKSVAYPETSATHRRERAAGRFDRVLNLPIEIDPDHVGAELSDGVLTVSLNRAERDKPRTIKVA
jgi:HSP20 family protein